jgi:hypothetical protein
MRRPIPKPSKIFRKRILVKITLRIIPQPSKLSRAWLLANRGEQREVQKRPKNKKIRWRTRASEKWEQQGCVGREKVARQGATRWLGLWALAENITTVNDRTGGRNWINYLFDYPDFMN